MIVTIIEHMFLYRADGTLQFGEMSWCASAQPGQAQWRVARGVPAPRARELPVGWLLVTSSDEPIRAADPQAADMVRDPLDSADRTLAARRRPMSERLELALSWNAVAAELRAGLLKATRHAPRAGD